MIEPVSTLREWLASDAGVAALVGERIASAFEPGGGFPQVVIYGATGSPSTTAQGGSIAGEWTATVWCLADRLAGGEDDRPDTQTAWAVAVAISNACDAIPGAPFTTAAGARIVDAEIVSATRAQDPDSGWGRAVVTLSFTTHSAHS